MKSSESVAAASGPRVGETWLKDELAERIASQAERLPEAAELLAALLAGERVAVRGLTGSARGYLASWLQRASGRALLYLVPHGDAFEEARDDVEYFRGAGRTLAYPEPDNLPYDPASPHPGIIAQRLETLAHLARG